MKQAFNGCVAVFAVGVDAAVEMKEVNENGRKLMEERVCVGTVERHLAEFADFSVRVEFGQCEPFKKPRVFVAEERVVAG